MTWTLAENQAKLAAGKLSALFNLHNPREGLQDISFNEFPLGDLKPLQVTATPPVSKETIIESYVRGEDLVATYAQLPERTVKPQLSFHDLSSSLEISDGAGIELVVAVQTSLLESDPTFSFVSEVNSKEIFGLSQTGTDWDAVDTSDEREISNEQFCGAFVFRLSDCDVSYAELIFPADFQGARLAGGHSATFRYDFFPQFFLEKGVIRKGRIWSILLPQRGDLESVQTCYQQMKTAPPPLTA